MLITSVAMLLHARLCIRLALRNGFGGSALLVDTDVVEIVQSLACPCFSRVRASRRLFFARVAADG